DDYALSYGMPRNALLRVYSVSPGGDVVSFWDPNPQTGAQVMDGVNSRLSFFRTAGMPQVWVLPVGPAVTSASVVASFTLQVTGATASLLPSGAIEFETLMYDSSAAMAFPIIAGSAIDLGIPEGSV